MPVGLEQEYSRHTKVYNGLINQGATCYLNSALQVLFMTKEFREAVERLAGTSNNEVLDQLHKLFEKLRGEHKCVTTVGITKCLKIYNVFEQQDAIEWIEKILNAVSSDASEVYNGTLRKSLRCVVDHRSNEDTSFFSIPLAMDTRDNIFNVVDGLRAFFQTTRFDEDDWLYCDDCDEKTDTEISLSLQKFPTILILQLKRFYFDYMSMEYRKNSCPSNIPFQVTYFKGHTYDLYAVINHSGVYGSGHYYAYIKSTKNNQWYCFDDSQVTKIRPTENNALERSTTAYIILYRKSEPLPSSTEEEAARGNKGPHQNVPKGEKKRSKESSRDKSGHAFKRPRQHASNEVSEELQISKEMNSSPLAEMPPHQDGFQAVVKDEMETGKSLPSCQEQNTTKNHTEDTSAVGVQERVNKEVKDSTMAETPTHQDAPLAAAEDEKETEELSPSSHQEQTSPKTFIEDTSAIVNEISEIVHSAPTVKGTNTRVPQPKVHQDKRKEEMDININQPVNIKHRGRGAEQEDKFSEDKPLLRSMHVENQAPLSRSSQDSVPAAYIRKAPQGENAWVVVLLVILLCILLVSTLTFQL